MEKKNRIVIPGPPGTGKTYRLLNHYMVKEIKENKTDPKKICYITFSKAAAEEATERFEELFSKEKLGYIGTMHALGVRELNIDVSAKLLRGNSQWNQFKLYEPMAARLNTDVSIDSITGKTRFKDPILTTRDYAKNKKISGKIFNVGSGKTVSINKIVNLLKGKKIYIPKRPGEPDVTFADISKIKKSKIIFTLHDMWAFCGTEHYVYDNKNYKFIKGYNYSDAKSLLSFFDIYQWKKKSHYGKIFM